MPLEALPLLLWRFWGGFGGPERCLGDCGEAVRDPGDAGNACDVGCIAAEVSIWEGGTGDAERVRERDRLRGLTLDAIALKKLRSVGDGAVLARVR